MSEQEIDDLLLCAIVAGVDLALGHPRMRHADAATDARIERAIERWHTAEEEGPQLLADDIPGWLLQLPNQAEAGHGGA